ncbi:hypothetical protein Ahae11616_16975 (plasmid) [Acinetobacter haemolyticus]|nr:hypothetical protein Ahae11616_16975 [Acinetobacter haemolyticus]
MISSWSTCHKILHILMFITSFGEQNITYKCCSNFLIHLSLSYESPVVPTDARKFAASKRLV